MAALQPGGADAPGPVTPEGDEARELGGGGLQEQVTVDNGDCAAKLIATATKQAALFGIEVCTLGTSIWLLRHALGGDIGVVRGAGALAAAVGGFEAACADVRELVRRTRGAQ
jgi:hypothetical protein